MFKTLQLVCVFSLMLRTVALAQGTPSISAETKRSYTSVKDHILSAVSKMPEDGFSFKPTPDIRSFAEVVHHVTEAQTHTCAAVLGETPKSGMESKMSKAEVISGLKASFDECDKAYDAVSDSNASGVIKTPRGDRTRLGALIGNIAHDQEQWGILSVYLRLKGIHPTGSE